MRVLDSRCEYTMGSMVENVTRDLRYCMICIAQSIIQPVEKRVNTGTATNLVFPVLGICQSSELDHYRVRGMTLQPSNYPAIQQSNNTGEP